MRPLSRREGVWIEIPELDVPTDVVWVSDTLGAAKTARILDTVRATGLLISTLAISVATADALVASDRLTAHDNAISADHVVVSDALVSALTVTSKDTVNVTAQLDARLVLSATVADGLLVTDALSTGLVQDTTDVIAVNDALAGSISSIPPPLSDLVVVSSLWSDTVVSTAPLLADTLVASDALERVLALIGTIDDTLLVQDALMGATYQTLVVTNAETGAVSTYTLTPTVTGLAEYRGTLYLASRDGLYAMDATEDYDGTVEWTLRTGFTALGTDRLKRIQDLNVLARIEGTTTLAVISDRTGDKQTLDYTLPPLTRNAYRDGVIKVGKGIQSVYYQFALVGTGPAEIDQLRLTVEPLSRRR